MPLLGSSLITVVLVRQEIPTNGLLFTQTLAIWAASVACMSLALLPTTFVAMLYGFFFGLQLSLPLMVTAYMLAAWLNYTLITKIDSGKLATMLQAHQRTQKVFKKLQNAPISVIVAARISPLLPFSVMNVVFAVVRTPLKKFIIGGFLGMLPRTFLAIYIGSEANNLPQLFEQNPNEFLLRISAIVLLIISVIGLGRYAKKIWQEDIE